MNEKLLPFNGNFLQESQSKAKARVKGKFFNKRECQKQGPTCVPVAKQKESRENRKTTEL